MKTILAICMIVTASFAWAAEGAAPSAPAGESVVGKVLNMKNVDNFTYLLLNTGRGEVWAAVLNSPVKEGATVTLENVIVMQNFQSNGLNKTFKEILFGQLKGAPASPAASSSMGASSTLGSAFSITPRKNLQIINDAPVAKAGGANAKTVAEVVTQAAALKGKTVVVRGKVTKYNPAIMGVNWIHLHDGSGSEADGSNDILVTTTDESSVGEVVTAKGVVVTDKDFGAGYAYKVLIEKANLQK